MKTCTRCHAVKSPSLFYAQRMNSKDGYQAHCKMCDNQRVAERKLRNAEQTQHTQAVADRNKYAKRKEIILGRNRGWKAANPGKVQAMDAKRRAATIRRTPLWLTADDNWVFEQAYELAAMRTKLFGFVWHVDHIVPLQGKLVSGLHVPHNLRVIPAIENLRKSNKFTVQTT